MLLLFEHKSNLDKSVNLQNYQNISEVIDDVRHKSKSPPKKLPPVIPIIIYHGDSPWNVSNSMQPMFELIKGVEKFLPQQESIVIDLSITADEKISGIAEVRAFILALKYSRNPLLFEKLPAIIHLFDGLGAQRMEYLDDLTTYLFYVTDQGKRGELSKIIQRELDLGDDTMRKFSSIWAELGYVAGEGDGIKKGEGIGFKKGIEYQKQLKEENEEKAIKRTLEKTALKMLKKGISIEEVSYFTGLSIEEVLVLKKKVKNKKR